MSKKKYKKRHSNSTIHAKRQAVQEQIADQKDRDRKRMDPTARLLLLADLVFLSAFAMLEQTGKLSPAVSVGSTAIGVALLLIALYLQFGRRRKGGPSQRPRD